MIMKPTNETTFDELSWESAVINKARDNFYDKIIVVFFLLT